MIFFENLNLVNAPYLDLFNRSFLKTVEEDSFILGNQLLLFEDEFAKYVGANHCIGVGSGLDALILPLLAWDFPKGSEVIVPANTYFATILAVIQAGLQPVLVDPDIETYLLNAKIIEKYITKQTRAILPVHLYGKPCNIGELKELADLYNLKLLEDCAQAHGARYLNQTTGSNSDAGSFSFYPTKILGALGDGGAITCNEEELANKLRALRNSGSNLKYKFQYLGINSKLDTIQAGFLRVKLSDLNNKIQERRKLASLYSTNLLDHVIKPVHDKSSYDVYHIYNIRHPERDKLRKYLFDNGVQTEIHYPIPPYLQPSIKGKLKKIHFPASDEIHSTTLSLPLSYAHTTDDVLKVVELVNDFV